MFSPLSLCGVAAEKATYHFAHRNAMSLPANDRAQSGGRESGLLCLRVMVHVVSSLLESL
jgi:hypothetical protein